jgi:curved DNA-binding protein CbpA
MPTVSTFVAWAESLPTLSYYGILRVEPNAEPARIKAAFHAFALRCHPDRYVDEGPDVAGAAAEVFKRGVEAYNVLSKPSLRARYDKVLAKGQLRLDPAALESVPPPPPKGKSLEEVAQTPRGKQHAVKAERLISIGHLEQARISLINATMEEPFNEELKERLNLLYEALALEPL